MYETFKFQIRPVMVVKDGDRVLGEEVARPDEDSPHPFVVYGLDGLQRFVDEWPAALDQLNAVAHPELAVGPAPEPAPEGESGGG